MPEPTFDASKAVTFDLAHGLVHLDDAPSRVLVPADALAALAADAGPESAARFGKSLGAPLGRRAARRLGAEAGTRSASVDAVVDHLGGELALAGLGTLSLERWGKALLIVIDQSPLAGAGEAVLAATLGSALSTATGAVVECVAIMRDETRVRLLIANAKTVEKVRAWQNDGVSWGEALTRLHSVPADAAGRGDA